MVPGNLQGLILIPGGLVELEKPPPRLPANITRQYSPAREKVERAFAVSEVVSPRYDQLSGECGQLGLGERPRPARDGEGVGHLFCFAQLKREHLEVCMEHLLRGRRHVDEEEAELWGRRLLV